MSDLNGISQLFFHAYWGSLDIAYVTIQSLWAYDLTAKMFDTCSILRDNDFMLSYEVLYYVTQSVAGFELFIGVTYDQYLKDAFQMMELSEDNLRKYIASLDPTMFALFHPEFGYYKRTGHTSVIDQYSADFHFFLMDNIETYSLDIPMSIIFQLWTIVYFIVIFTSFFFAFFNSANKEEWAADVEYAISNLTVEVEKEIFAADDAIYLILSLIFLFGAYFGFLALSYASTGSDASFFFWALPMIVLSLIAIPLNLLCDFGLLFLLYLRGASNTASFFFELAYDYIGVIAFFTRLVVQFVRLVLMFVVYSMMHDTVMLQQIAHWFLPAGDSFYDEIMNIRFTSGSISYFLAIALPCRLAYWTYEVIHTFFVVTAQLAAFFTIAFWLFLLFYTFFVFEKYEHHFRGLRRTHELLDKELAYLKARNNKQ